MTGLLGEICQLFCCPPRPSHIVAKLAFLPPHPTYSIVSGANDSKCRIEFKPEAGWYMPDDAASRLSIFYTITKRHSRIVCMYIPTCPIPSPHHSGGANMPSNMPPRRCVSPISLSSKSTQAMSASCPILTNDPMMNNRQQPASTGDVVPETPYTVLFSHGNAVDIGQMAGFLQSLAYRFSVNILCYDYSGYGASTGQRLEENLYADAEAALKELRERYSVPLEKIVLYGQSIGTAPTVELATKHKVAGVVLHSPFMSGLRVVCPSSTRRFCFDPFTNIDKVSRILSPTLIIHGTDDEIIGIHHGRELFSRLPHPLEPAWIDGAGHNDIELFSEYATRLDRFFNVDLVHTNSGDNHDTQPSSFSTRLPELSPSPSSCTSRSIFGQRKASVCRTKLRPQPTGICRNGSASTVGTTDNSKSDTYTESTESVRLASTEGEVTESTYNCLTSLALNAGDQNGCRNTSKRRVWTMRKDSAPVNTAVRSKTIHNVTSSGTIEQTTTTSLGSVKVPAEAIPRPPPLRSRECRVEGESAHMDVDPENGQF